MASALRRCCAGLSAFVALSFGVDHSAIAQVIDIPEIVVTPNFTPTATGEVGSSVSIITRDEIVGMSSGSITQVFRRIPGVTVIESGGPGGSAEVRLRGAETGHTLVLIDGVRVNDFATARDDFDFALLLPNDIERIEILRGPQSALYGSDAIGGVINIITRKPEQGVSALASVEGGSYGTHIERLAGNMSAGDLSVRLSGTHFSADGFSRRGDRDADEADSTEKWAGSFGAVYAPADGPTIETGVTALDQSSDYDSFSDPNAPYTVDRTSISGFGKISWPTFDGKFTQSLTGFFLDSTRENREPGGSLPVSQYDATSVGAEYQGVLDLAAHGSLLVGARIENEVASNTAETTESFPGYDSDRVLYAAYSLYQLSPVENLHLTFGGRFDGEVDGDGFLTGRVTAAYEIPESGTTLRASAGTGAKRPTAYQMANNAYIAAKYPDDAVDTDLQPEQSIGVDAGIEQALFNGDVEVSATVFYNYFHDLLAFESIAFPDGAYENIDRAETAGVEVGAGFNVLPGLLKVGASYTYLYSRNLDTGGPLPRRPKHTAALDVTLMAGDRFEMTLSGVLVGERYNSSRSTTPSPGYGRLDLSARYKLQSGAEIFGRVENITDTQYQDPDGYNAPGVGAYVGLKWEH